MIKINFLNASNRSDEWLKSKIELVKKMFSDWDVVIDYDITKADKPSDTDFILSNYSVLGGDNFYTINYDYVKKQMLKLDSETVGAVCVICIDPSEKANCNYTFKDIDNLSVVPCLVVCDDTCEHYMRHEIIHSIFGYIKNIGNINLPDTQDPDLVGAGLSYNIMSPEAMEIERKNLQTCMPYLSLLNKKPVKFHLMVALYQMIITLLTTLLGLLKKKNKITNLTKEDVVQILAKGHSHFEGWNIVGSIADKLNNPGCLKYASQINAVENDNGFAQFNTEQDGWNALYAQIRLNLSGKSRLYDINKDFYAYINVYASTSPENERKEYAEYLAMLFGVSPNTKLKDLWS